MYNESLNSSFGFIISSGLFQLYLPFPHFHPQINLKQIPDITASLLQQFQYVRLKDRDTYKKYTT